MVDTLLGLLLLIWLTREIYVELNAVILRNKGFPLEVAATEPIPDSDPPRWRRVVENETTGEPKKTKLWARFDGNVIAEVEDLYGSSEAYQTAIEAKPHSVIRQVLALMHGRDPFDIGTALLDDKFPDYLLSMQMAWSVAMGMDPTQAAKAHEVAKREMAKEMAQAAEALEAELAEAAAELDDEAKLPDSTSASPSPGESGTEPGTPQEATPSASGA